MLHKSSKTWLFAIICMLVMMPTAPTSGETINHQMKEMIPDVIEYLQSKSYRTVGGLKFRVKKPGEKMTDSAGSINSLLAGRLEVGLILANPFEESQHLQIIRDASGQLASIENANHLTADGRHAIFNHQYELSWGEASANADAFLTGVVVMHDDLQTASVAILCFDREGGKLERIGEVFEADFDAETLGEIGESFRLRGAFDGGNSQLNPETKRQKKEQQIRLFVKEVKEESAPFPLKDPRAPVRLEVLYDGQSVDIETRNGRAFLKEPVTGQNVQFVVHRNKSANGTLGIVLKVNGENTLNRETQRDLDCRKWLLEPGTNKVVISGYQMDQSTAEEFTVLSRSESASRAMDYGRNVGLIQLTVFRELQGNPHTEIQLDEDEEDLAAMLRGRRPNDVPGDLSSLKRQIRKAGRTEKTRGLIVQGERKRNEIREVPYRADPTPVMSATVTYYKP